MQTLRNILMYWMFCNLRHLPGFRMTLLLTSVMMCCKIFFQGNCLIPIFCDITTMMTKKLSLSHKTVGKTTMVTTEKKLEHSNLNQYLFFSTFEIFLFRSNCKPLRLCSVQTKVRQIIPQEAEIIFYDDQHPCFTWSQWLRSMMLNHILSSCSSVWFTDVLLVSDRFVQVKMGTYLHRGLENVKEEMWSNVQLVACIQFYENILSPKSGDGKWKQIEWHWSFFSSY